MTYKQFLTQMICSSSNASAIAESLSGKFKSMYNKATNISLYITDASDEVPDGFIYVDLNDEVVALDPVKLKQALANSIENDVGTISVINEFDQQVRFVDADVVLNSVTGTAFNNLLNWLSYDSITDDDPAQAFLDKATLNGLHNTEYSQAVYSVYEILKTTKDKVSLLTGLNNFNGMDLINDQDDYNSVKDKQIKISDYTGVKPWIAWCSSLNISFDLEGLITFPIQFQKMIDKLVVSILAGIGKAVTALFSPIATWIGQGINPSDYVCKDDTFGYFNIPAYGITFDQSYLANVVDDLKGAVPWKSDDTVVLQLYNNYFYYYPAEQVKFTEGGRTVNARKYVRYLRPVNPRAILEIFKNGKYDLRKPGDALMFLKHLQLTDLNLHNPNIEADQDLLWATKISAMLSQSLLLFLNLWGESAIWYSSDEFNATDVIDVNDDSSFGSKWNTFRDFLLGIIDNCQSWVDYDGDEISFINPLPVNSNYYHQVGFAATTHNGKVSNYNFADYLSSIIVAGDPYDPQFPKYWELGLDDGSIRSSYEYDGYISPVPLNSFHGFNEHGISNYLREYICDPFLVIQNFALGIYGDSHSVADRQLFIPFKSNCPIEVSPNITIKTDSDNLAQYRSNLRKVVGIGVGVAAIVTGGYLAVKARKFMNAQALSLMTTRTQLEAAIQAGDYTTATQLSKQLVKKTKKYSRFAKVLGASPILGTTAPSAMAVNIENGTTDTSMLEDIIHTLK